MKKRNLSISSKWSVILGLMIVMLLLVGIFINHFFFYDYYLIHEKNDMLEFSNSLNDVYGDDESVDRLIYEMTSKKQVSIAIVTDSDHIHFDYNLLKTHLTRGKKYGGQVNIDYPTDTVEKLNEDGYFFLNISENQFKLPLLGLIYQLDSGEVLLVSMPLEVVTSSANIAIEFNIMIAIVLIVLGMIIVYFMAKTMTRPIISLSDMTKKISEFDFSERFEGQSNDEIGALGEHINAMSQRLEETLLSLKNSNNQLSLDLKEKEKIVQMRKSFIANISHELKTPIALIMSYTEGIKINDNLSQNEKDQYFAVIEKEASHMDQLVKDLLDLTELEYDATTLNKSNIDFSSLVDEVLDRYNLWIKEKELTVIIEKDDIIMFTGDKRRLEQGIDNLIINGIDHCPKGGRLELKVEEKENNIVFSIFNSGSKISENDSLDIFHKFYKGDLKEKRTLGGSGIGLSILAAVIEKHLGHYGAYNVDDGVTFWFDIPSKSI